MPGYQRLKVFRRPPFITCARTCNSRHSAWAVKTARQAKRNVEIRRMGRLLHENHSPCPPHELIASAGAIYWRPLLASQGKPLQRSVGPARAIGGQVGEVDVEALSEDVGVIAEADCGRVGCDGLEVTEQ
jgi:hypothetical protein